MPSGSRKYAIMALAYNKAGKLVATGKNSYVKTHPLQARYAARVGKPLAIYLHAEFSALLKAREPVHRLVITRFDSKGNPMNAAPCPICRELIKDFKVKHVEYT